jgi:tetratricopeptide (TPR) repeat protein
MRYGSWLAIGIGMTLGGALAWSQTEPAAPPAAAQTWAGRRVILKKPGIKIGYTDAQGKQVYNAELKFLSYLVNAEQDGFLQVEQRGAMGWFDKNDALLPEDAIPYFTQRAATAGPKEVPTALAYLGWAYREKKDFANAIKSYDQAIARQPGADWNNNRGMIYLDMREYDKAIADFTEALRQAPGFVLAMENRSIANQAIGRPDPALADLAEVMRQDPKAARNFLRRGQLHGMKQEHDEALKDFDMAVSLEPKNVEYLLQRGDFHAERKQYAKAYADYAEAAKLAPLDPDPLLHRSRAFVDEKKFPNALVDLEAARKLDPKNVETLIGCGEVQFLTGHYDLAAADYEAAAKSDPKNPLVYSSRAWLMATCPDAKYRDGKKAEEYARKAVELTEGKDPVFRDALAAALAEQGRFDEAIKLQEVVVTEITEGPDAKEAKDHLDAYKKKMPFRQLPQK